jgi:hypothetical protein
LKGKVLKESGRIQKERGSDDEKWAKAAFNFGQPGPKKTAKTHFRAVIPPNF